jgi:hypothetical protein
VKARLIEFKREEDKDIHLVIGVPSSPKKTMIVEFPDTTCPGASSSPKKSRMAKGPLSADQCVRPGPGPVERLRRPEGDGDRDRRGFFDVKHSTPQTGVASNNIELHPVLRIAAATCSR